MKAYFLPVILPAFFPAFLPAQAEIYVHQSCRQCVVGVINHPEITGKAVDAQTLLFVIPWAEEPVRISFHIDTAGFKTERLWVDSATTRMDLWVYNCKAYQSRVERANLLTKEERANNLYFDYIAQKFEDRALYVDAFNSFLLSYIREHPGSFLSLNYVSKLAVTEAEIAEMLQILEPGFGRYPTFQKMKNRLLYKGKVKPGEPLPAFEALDLQGNRFSGKDLHRKATVLMFWHSGCSWSKRVMPRMQALRKELASQGAEVVYFSLDENRALWESTLAGHPEGLHVSDLQGFYGRTPLELGVSATPYFFVLDGEGRVRLCTFGDEVGLVEKSLREILANQANGAKRN